MYDYEYQELIKREMNENIYTLQCTQLVRCPDEELNKLKKDGFECDRDFLMDRSLMRKWLSTPRGNIRRVMWEFGYCYKSYVDLIIPVERFNLPGITFPDHIKVGGFISGHLCHRMPHIKLKTLHVCSYPLIDYWTKDMGFEVTLMDVRIKISQYKEILKHFRSIAQLAEFEGLPYTEMCGKVSAVLLAQGYNNGLVIDCIPEDYEGFAE